VASLGNPNGYFTKLRKKGCEEVCRPGKTNFGVGKKKKAGKLPRRGYAGFDFREENITRKGWTKGKKGVSEKETKRGHNV